MDKPCAMDLCERIFGHIAAGHSCWAVDRVSGSRARTAADWQPNTGTGVPLYQAAQPCAWHRRQTRAPHVLSAGDYPGRAGHHVEGIGRALEETHDVLVQLSSFHRVIVRAEFSYKKGLITRERARAYIKLVRHKMDHLASALYR